MDEKPYAPSTRKLKEARARGEIPYSSLLTLVGSTAIMLSVFGLRAPFLYRKLQELMIQGLSGEALALKPLLYELSVFFVTALAAGWTLGLLQTGGGLFWQRLKPQFRKRGSTGRMSTFLLTWGAVILPLICFLKFFSSSCAQFGTYLYQLAWAIMGLLLCVALLDFWLGRLHFYRQQRMTREEQKEEQRDA